MRPHLRLLYLIVQGSLLQGMQLITPCLPRLAPRPNSCSSCHYRSHLQGMFFRTVRMLEAGMKPV